VTKTITAKSPGQAALAKVQFLAACLLNAGRPKDAEQALRAVSARATGADIKRTLALALARQGKLDEAVAVYLEILEKNPEDTATRQTAVALLHRQAVRAINAGDWAVAGSAVGEVLKLDPANPAIQKLLSSIENVLPVARLKAGQRQEAAEGWEKAQRQRPESGSLAHSLALLYHFWALSLEDAGKRVEAGPLWEKAVANWVVVRYDDAFWAAWIKQRRTVYPITEEALATLRKNWAGDLEKRFRQWTVDSETGGKKRIAEQRRGLEMCYWLEQVTACLLYELRKVQCPSCRTLTTSVPDEEGRPACEGAGCRKPIPKYRPAHSLAVAGPIFLKLVGAEAPAQEMLAGAAKLPNGGALSAIVKDFFKGDVPPFLKTNAEVLRICLSPFGKVLAMLAHGRMEEAVASLEKELPAKGKGSLPADARLVMLYSCLERGKQLTTVLPQLPADPNKERATAYVTAVKAALEAWKKAVPHRDADKGLSGELGERIENLAVRGGNEFHSRGETSAGQKQWARGTELLTYGIDLMELAIAVERRPRMSETISVLYSERGLYHHKNSDTEAGLTRAISDLETALKHSPQNARGKELLAGALDLKGCRLIQPYNNQSSGRPPSYVLREAQGLFRRAKELDPTDPDHRQHYDIVSRALN
jgi:tetratricopeptide (TPR) repeat protein